VAWAPLGPVGVSVSYYSTPSLWIAVRGDHFRRPLRHRHFIRTSHLGVVFKSTREYRSHRHGPSVDYVTRVTRTPVRRAKVVTHVRPYHHRHHHKSRAVQVTRPRHEQRRIEKRHHDRRIEKRNHSRPAVQRHQQARPMLKQAPVVKQPPSRVVREREVRVEKNRSVKVKHERRGRDRGERHRH
jgi:hypothetical protein